MTSTNETRRWSKFKTRVTALVFLGLFALLLLTNPTEQGFRKYIQQYIMTESGSTVKTKDEIPVPIFIRTNYYLYSFYETEFGGNKHEFVGIFGAFRSY